MDLGLKGKSVLVTGGSKGIGLACAKAFAAEGCLLHLAARDKDRLAQASWRATARRWTSW
ncbi:MAG: SDR family NAD(P)-dependent oxidoreductase [Betaproteobacteria bacterium]|nr:MAG: SDR family NAD(P)-dependent oxidoreductase [Betaproteobacteria bacterium]